MMMSQPLPALPYTYTASEEVFSEMTSSSVMMRRPDASDTLFVTMSTFKFQQWPDFPCQETNATSFTN